MLIYRALSILLTINMVLVRINNKLIYLNRTTCPNNARSYKFVFLEIEQNHITSLQIVNASKYILRHTQLGQNFYEETFTSTSNILPIFRSTYLNNFLAAPNTAKFLVIGPNYVRIHQNFSSTSRINLDFSSFPSYAVFDACFGNSYQQVFVVGIFDTSSYYSMLIYNKTGGIGYTFQSKNNLTTSTIKSFDKMVCKYSRIFISFQTVVMIYAMNSSLTKTHNFTIPSTQIFYMDFSIYKQKITVTNTSSGISQVSQHLIFGYLYDNIINMVNLTTSNRILLNSALAVKFSTLQIVSSYFIVFGSPTIMIQFDYQQSIIIDKVNMPIFNQIQDVRRIDLNTLAVNFWFYAKPYVDPYLYFYEFTDYYDIASGQTCVSTYALNTTQGRCIKINTDNYVISAINTSTNTTNNNTSTNTSTNTSNSSNNTNNVTNQTNVTNTSNASSGSIISNFTLSNNTIQDPIVELKDNTVTPITQVSNTEASIYDDIYSTIQDTLTPDVSNGISTIIIASSFKFSPQFLLSFSLIFDDMWFYSYHRSKSSSDSPLNQQSIKLRGDVNSSSAQGETNETYSKYYPKTVQLFFKKVQFINLNKLNPWFFNIIQTLTRDSNYAINNNQDMKQYLNIQSLNEDQQEIVYFSKQIVEKSKNNIILTFMLFGLMKTIKLVIYLCYFRRKNKAQHLMRILKREQKRQQTKYSKTGTKKNVDNNQAYRNQSFVDKIYLTIHRNSQLWLGFCSIIEGNYSLILFSLGVQSLMFSQLDQLDRANLCNYYLVGFVYTAYSVAFYPLIYNSKRKSSAKIVLMPCRYRLQSYLFQPVLMLTRVLLRSFVHGYFLRNYDLQMMLLFLIDSPFVFLCIRFRKCFKNRIIFVLYTAYVLLFASFDLYFYLEHSQRIAYNNDVREKFGIIVVSSLIGVSVLISLVLFIELMVEICKKICRYLSNKKCCIKFSTNTSRSLDFQSNQSQVVKNKSKKAGKQRTQGSQKEKRRVLKVKNRADKDKNLFQIYKSNINQTNQEFRNSEQEPTYQQQINKKFNFDSRRIKVRVNCLNKGQQCEFRQQLSKRVFAKINNNLDRRTQKQQTKKKQNKKVKGQRQNRLLYRQNKSYSNEYQNTVFQSTGKKISFDINQQVNKLQRLNKSDRNKQQSNIRKKER